MFNFYLFILPIYNYSTLILFYTLNLSRKECNDINGIAVESLKDVDRFD